MKKRASHSLFVAALALSGCAGAASETTGQHPREAVPVVLVTDCGVDIDDQWAIAHAVLTPMIDVRAILTTHAPGMGEQSAQITAQCVRTVLAKFPPTRVRPPIITGASTALVDEKTPTASFAVAALRALAKTYTPERPLHVVLIAPATDVASALLLEPAIAPRMVVHAMAFDTAQNENAELNARNDVAAWQALYASHVPISIGGGDTSKRSLMMTREEALATLGGTPVGDYLVETFDAWLATHGELVAKVAQRSDAWPVWDEIAIADVLTLATTEERPRPNTLPSESPQQNTIRWVVDVDKKQLWRNLASVTSNE